MFGGDLAHARRLAAHGWSLQAIRGALRNAYTVAQIREGLGFTPPKQTRWRYYDVVVSYTASPTVSVYASSKTAAKELAVGQVLKRKDHVDVTSVRITKVEKP